MKNNKTLIIIGIVIIILLLAILGLMLFQNSPLLSPSSDALLVAYQGFATSNTFNGHTYEVLIQQVYSNSIQLSIIEKDTGITTPASGAALSLSGSGQDSIVVGSANITLKRVSLSNRLSRRSYVGLAFSKPHPPILEEVTYTGVLRMLKNNCSDQVFSTKTTYWNEIDKLDFNKDGLITGDEFCLSNLGQEAFCLSTQRVSYNTFSDLRLNTIANVVSSPVGCSEVENIQFYKENPEEGINIRCCKI
jgi:hypothetical protein